MVGGLLVTVSGVGLFAASTRTQAGPAQSYLVAARALAAGSRLTATDVVLQPVDLPTGMRARAFDAPSVLEGATLLAPLAPGELVQASTVVAKETGGDTREVSLVVDRGRVTAGLAGGERVDLLATYGSGDDAYTLVVAQSALVVAVERGRGGLGDASPTILTVGIDDPGEAIALAHASQAAKITPLRATGVDSVTPGSSSRDIGAIGTYRPPLAVEGRP